MFKIKGQFDMLTDMFVLTCSPVLSNTNKELVIYSDPMSFSTSHMPNLSIIDFTQNASVLLGYSTEEASGMKLYDIISPDCLIQLSEIHLKCNRFGLNFYSKKNFLLNVFL